MDVLLPDGNLPFDLLFNLDFVRLLVTLSWRDSESLLTGVRRGFA
jgi:hypothetical protein